MLNFKAMFLELRCRGGVVAGARQLPVIFQRFGFKRGCKYLLRWLKRNDYQSWIRQYDVLDEHAKKASLEQINAWALSPKIALLMVVDNHPVNFLKESIESIQAQVYDNWELLVVDNASIDTNIRSLLEGYAQQDVRIKVSALSERSQGALALNGALEKASGPYVAIIRAVDLLPPHALFNIANAINQHPDAALIYTDEDKLTEQGVRYDPWFKTDLNYELLLAQNGFGDLAVYRRDLIAQVGGFRPGFGGVENYDLALRVIERVAPKQVIHIPRVLYHQRILKANTAPQIDISGQDASLARKAITEHLARSGRGGHVSPAPEAPQFNRVRYPSPATLPLVSVIIPTRDRADLLGMCLDSLFDKTTYRQYEVIIVDNGSVEAATQALFNRLPGDKVTIIRDDAPFNYSRLNNLAVRQAKGSIVCLMNNDIEILSPDWMEEMLSFACQPDIGCVGARLWFPDGRLQHAGVVIGLGGVAGHPNKYFPRGHRGYFGRAVLAQSFSAVTAACLMVRREAWEKVQGLDETLAIAFNDVDFCLRVNAAGYRNVWTPYAEMNHHESASRGNETSPEKLARYEQEISLMQTRWGDAMINDPAYNPNLTHRHDDFSLAWPPRLHLTVEP